MAVASGPSRESTLTASSTTPATSTTQANGRSWKSEWTPRRTPLSSTSGASVTSTTRCSATATRTATARSTNAFTPSRTSSSAWSPSSTHPGLSKKRYSFTPYGAPTFLDAAFGNPSLSSNQAWHYLFTGRRLDPITGLYFYRTRYYHAKLGRFAARDPMRPSFQPNRYKYVRSSPVLFVDPIGLLEEIPTPQFLVSMVDPSAILPIVFDPDPGATGAWVNTAFATPIIFIPLSAAGNQPLINSMVLHEQVGHMVSTITGEEDSSYFAGGMEYATQAFSNLAQLARASQTGLGCATKTFEHFEELGAPENTNTVKLDHSSTNAANAIHLFKAVQCTLLFIVARESSTGVASGASSRFAAIPTSVLMEPSI